MTVTYTHKVANARLGGFSSLLLRWRGSVYKLFYKEFTIYIIMYAMVSSCYRLISDSTMKANFEKLCLQFQTYTDLVPISFVLGFYVSVVVGRWWQQYIHIPWPDRTMMLVAANVHGSDHRGRLIRRTLMRYMSLAEVLTYRSISTAVFKRFPTIQHVIDAGFMSPSEYKQYETVKTDNVKYFVPFIWFSNLLSKTRQEGRIYDDVTYQAIMKEMNDYRSGCGMLFGYDWISVPLVYTQVVTVAVYAFFMSTLLSRQYLDVTKKYPGHEVDLYIPIFTIFQFFFYVGWLKVAEQLINPFGEDDDDFEVNVIIDRNVEITMLAVDQLYLTHPKLEKDMYWNNPNPSIPYTAASANHKVDAFLGSTMDMSLSIEGMRIVEETEELNLDGGEWNPGLDPEQSINNNYNRNLTHLIPTKSMPKSPPSYAKLHKTPNKTAASNPVNFWLKRLARKNEEAESKMVLLEMNNKSSQGVEKEELLTQLNEANDGFGLQLPDEDSADSDIGHGGGSEEDETNDEKDDRRSILSSIDGDREGSLEDKITSENLETITMEKYSIPEFEERPIAKKSKSSHTLKSLPIGEMRPSTLPVKSKAKRRKFSGIRHNSSEGNLKSVSGHFSLGKSKKSPKKKCVPPKIHIQDEFTWDITGDTDNDRKNAMMRTLTFQRNHKKKSAQALHRNAKRTSHAGNAWLRHKHPNSWTSDMSPADYASMTSGAEENQAFDSPFGSVNSFATCAPSPMPLRFSLFGKRGKRIRMESVSSSGMTSPGIFDESAPAFSFVNDTVRPREESVGSVSMPFTENLRRRLLVAKSYNSPNSSNTTSPAPTRAHLPNQQPHYHPQVSRSSLTESDDFLMVSPNTKVSTTASTWENTLEAIGEITHPNHNKPAKALTHCREIRPETTDSAAHLPEPADQSNIVAKDIPQSLGINQKIALMPVPQRAIVNKSTSFPKVPVNSSNASSDITKFTAVDRVDENKSEIQSENQINNSPTSENQRDGIPLVSVTKPETVFSERNSFEFDRGDIFHFTGTCSSDNTPKGSPSKVREDGSGMRESVDNILNDVQKDLPGQKKAFHVGHEFQWTHKNPANNQVANFHTNLHNADDIAKKFGVHDLPDTSTPTNYPSTGMDSSEKYASENAKDSLSTFVESGVSNLPETDLITLETTADSTAYRFNNQSESMLTVRLQGDAAHERDSHQEKHYTEFDAPVKSSADDPPEKINNGLTELTIPQKNDDAHADSRSKSTATHNATSTEAIDTNQLKLEQPRLGSSDLGYCSSKEDIEANAACKFVRFTKTIANATQTAEQNAKTPIFKICNEQIDEYCSSDIPAFENQSSISVDDASTHHNADVIINIV